MDGKTHAALGAATALWVLQPKSPTDVVLITSVGALAGILPDVDLQQSKASHVMNRVVVVSIALLLILLVDSRVKGLTLAQLLTGSAFLVSLLGLAVILAFYFYGSKQPHRGFTHSLIALGICALGGYLVDPHVLPAVLLGYTSHLVIDLFNTKGEQILWPYEGRWCFGLCKANGMTALSIRLVATLAVAIYIALLARCLL